MISPTGEQTSIADAAGRRLREMFPCRRARGQAPPAALGGVLARPAGPATAALTLRSARDFQIGRLDDSDGVGPVAERIRGDCARSSSLVQVQDGPPRSIKNGLIKIAFR